MSAPASQLSVDVLTDPAAIAASYPIISQLRPHLTAEGYVAAVTRMMASGFRLAAVRDGGRMVAVAGYRVLEGLVGGRYLYVDDLVTDEQARSKGYGKTLLDWLKDQARANGCAELHLDSGVQRHGAHRFYLRERLDISCYHFKIALHQP
jgi:GNAT superfamily N-acetyltransferase